MIPRCRALLSSGFPWTAQDPPGRRRSRFLPALIAALTLVACGDDTTGPAPHDPADVSTTLSSLPAWSSISPPVEPSADSREGDPTGEPAALSASDDRYVDTRYCTVTEYTLAKNPEAIVSLSSSSLIVPGLLIEGDSHLSGTMEQLSIVERAPITLVINEAAALVPAREVQAPSLATLQTAVNQLIQDAESSGYESGSSVLLRKTSSHSSEQAFLGLGFSARYMKTEVAGQLETRTSAERSTVIASFTENAFTITADGPELAQDWFTDEFTQEKLDQLVQAGRISDENPPLYISEVTYGRIATVNFTSTASRSSIEGMFEATVNGGVGDFNGRLDASQQEMVRNAELQVVSLGGPPEGGLQFAREILPAEEADPDRVGLAEFFAQDVALTTFVPISFVISDLRTGEVARVGDRTTYERLDCSTRAESTFESSIEGWTASEARSNYPLRGTGTSSKSGNGHLRVGEDTNGITYLHAPGKFTGDLLRYSGGSLSYWTRWEPCVFGPGPTQVDCSGGTGGSPLNGLSWPDARFHSGTSEKILVYHAPVADFDFSTWVRRDVVFSPSANLRVYNPTNGETIANAVQATQEDIDEVLADISRIDIRGEHRGGFLDTVWLDDVELNPPALPFE